MNDDVRAVLDGTRRWAVVRGDAVVWMLRLAWELGPFAHTTFCDPPYHLTGAKGGERGFMGTTWDGGDVAHRVETWRAALMCSLPGAHLLAASGTRTYHRLAVAAEDAGWEPREMVGWLCAQGMAKTGDVSKRIDKMHGATREAVGKHPNPARNGKAGTAALGGGWGDVGDVNITAPATDDARQWEGWSESLAPSMEPMLLARKPFRGSTAANLLTHRCGALNIDAGRVGVESTGSTDGRWPKTIAIVHNDGCRRVGTKKVSNRAPGGAHDRASASTSILSGTELHGSDVGEPKNGTKFMTEEVVDAWECEPSCAAARLDAQAGPSKPTPAHLCRRGSISGSGRGYGSTSTGNESFIGYADNTSNVSRYYYAAKASARERWMLVTCGCGRRAMRRTAAKHLTERKDKTTFCTLCKQPARVAQHATVKPLDLDRWLARLVCVPGGVTLVPFCGSGSEMIAALEAGSRVIGFELEPDHADIAIARLTAWEQGDRDDHDDPVAAVESLKPEGPRQRSLFGGGPR